jgi:hypothetical protein
MIPASLSLSLELTLDSSAETEVVETVASRKLRFETQQSATNDNHRRARPAHCETHER